MLGVIDVSITVGGSVASMSSNSAVHENVRASMMPLASAACALMRSRLLASMRRRASAARAVSVRATASSRAASAARPPCRPDRRRYSLTLKAVNATTSDRGGADQPVDEALVVERPGGEVGPQHRHPTRSRSSTPTGAAMAARSPPLALSAAIRTSARGSISTTAWPMRCSRARPSACRSPSGRAADVARGDARRAPGPGRSGDPRSTSRSGDRGRRGCPRRRPAGAGTAAARRRGRSPSCWRPASRGRAASRRAAAARIAGRAAGSPG